MCRWPGADSAGAYGGPGSRPARSAHNWRLQTPWYSAMPPCASRIADGMAQQVRVDQQDLVEFLGPTKFEDEVALRVGMPGVEADS